MKEHFFKKAFTSPLLSRFIIFFVILAAFPLLIVGTVSLYLFDASHRQDVSNLELQLIDQKIEEIRKFFADTLDVIRLRVGIAENTALDNPTAPWQEILAQELIDANAAFEEISFINPQGKEVAKRSRIVEETELISVRLLPKFQQAITGKDYISEVYYTLSGPMITLAAPVKVGEQIIQVVAAEVNLSALTRSLEAARLGESGYVLLLDQNGALIAGQSGKNISIGSNLGAWERVKELMEGIVFDGLGERDRYESFISGTAVVASGKKISEIGWIMLAEWPLSDADAVIGDVRDQIVLFVILALAAIVLAAPFFAARLIYPIRLLEEGAVAVEQGDFEKHVDIKTRDELEDLGNAFNNMVKGLKRLRELKSEFVFIAAHELRSPVTAIRGWLSMVKEKKWGAREKELYEYIDPVSEANDRLVNLVNDILEIARSEAGRIKIKVSALDIRESVETVLTELKPVAGQKKISLEYARPEAPLPVLADAVRLKEVFSNFISNAIKYNNEGGWIKVTHESGENSIITHVEDNGFGMSEEDKKRLFEKFFRAETGVSKGIEGTGLGLFITKELIEKMGGAVWVTSELGKGSRFSFRLPVASPT
jgi:signal transduction histidine kinase